MAVSTPTAILGSSLIGGATSLLQDRPSPPSPPKPPRKTVTEVAPGVKTVRRRVKQPDGSVVVKEERVLSDEKQQERRKREQMIDELFQSIGTTDQERQKQFKQAKQSFIEQFNESIIPQFENQQANLRAQQEATGRAISSVGAQERQDLQEEQNQTLAQNRRRAEQIARDLQAQEEQRKLNLIGQLQQGLDTQTARVMQGMNQNQQLANTAFSTDRARFQAEQAANQLERQRQNQIAQTVGALGGFGASQFFGGGPQTGLGTGRLAGSTIDAMRQSGVSDNQIAKTALNMQSSSAQGLGDNGFL